MVGKALIVQNNGPFPSTVSGNPAHRSHSRQAVSDGAWRRGSDARRRPGAIEWLDGLKRQPEAKHAQDFAARVRRALD